MAGVVEVGEVGGVLVGGHACLLLTRQGSLVADIAGFDGNAAIAGNAINLEETVRGDSSASLRGFRQGESGASSECPLAADIAGNAGNSAIAGNRSASGQPAAGEHVGVLEPDDDAAADF